jgi:hypothetical protein
VEQQLMYAWTASLGGLIPAGQAANQDLSGLVAGTYDGYNGYQWDPRGCKAIRTMKSLNHQPALSSTNVNVLCYGGNTGSIDLTSRWNTSLCL